MDVLHAIILGVVEGVTEFLPISSTGHLTIVEKLLGYQVDAAGITAFTAVIQIGAIGAAVVYFWRDIIRIAMAWCAGLFDRAKRDFDYRMGWYIIIATIPVAIAGLLLKPVIEGAFRSLWVVAAGLIIWSVVMFAADRVGRATRSEKQITWKDAFAMGLMQCFALIPGVSRSGATISAGLFRNIDRVAATRLSFFMGIPALVAAGGLEATTKAKYISTHVGWAPTLVGVVVSFIVGYISIAWLLKFVANHTFSPFVVYRVLLGAAVVALLGAHIITAN